MIRQISILTKALLCNFLDINVLRYTKDKQKRSRSLLVGCIWVMLIGILCFYVGGLAYGYILLGLETVVPMYLIMISSILILFFSMFKAEKVIFQKNSYEILCSMPVSKTAIVVSRFLSMYLGNVLLAFLVMIPGMGVYAYFMRPGFCFYFFGVVGMLVLPMIPMTVATLIGALITAISSGMKHKNLVAAFLSVALVVGGLFAGTKLSILEKTDITKEMLLDLAGIVSHVIGKLYPPAIWLGEAMVVGRLFYAVLFFGLSILVFILMVVLVSANFQRICQSLYSTTAKHNYQMQNLSASSVWKTLYKKELKRYFASSIYVTNTIMGPIMMLALAVALCVMGEEQITHMLPIKTDIIGLIPFALAATSCLMTTTSTSLSMEGKEWWIVKSLPITAKQLFDSKILLNLTVIAPFYVVSEIAILLTWKPAFLDAVWLIVLPIILVLFACVFGITVNLLFPVFRWENDAVIVKQSASSAIGGFGGAFIILLCALPVGIPIPVSDDLVKLIIVVVMFVGTVVLYQKNIRVNLQKIDE